MRPFVIQLEDRAVAFARDGKVLSSAPSAVWDGSTGEPAGTNAWNALRRHPMATSTRHLGTLLSQSNASDRIVALVAAELMRRLAVQPPAPPECDRTAGRPGLLLPGVARARQHNHGEANPL